MRSKPDDGKKLVAYKTGKHGLRIAAELASGEKYAYDYDENGKCINASSAEHEVKQQHLRRYFFHRINHRALDQRDGNGVRHGYTGSRELSHVVYFERFGVEYRLLRSGRLRVFTPDGSHHDFWRSDADEIIRENGNGTDELTIYDYEDRLAARLCWDRQRAQFGPDWTTRYHYNGAGELLAHVDNEQGVVRYVYNAEHRLVEQHDQRGARYYSYDAAGNITYTPNHGTIGIRSGNLLTFAGAERLEYNERYVLSKRIKSDGSTVVYTYDSLDQLIEVRWSDRNEVWKAAYDGLGRRLYREYGGKRTDFYWDGDRLAAERGHDGKLRLYVYANTDALVPFMWLDYDSETAEPETAKAYYVFANGTGMPLRIEDAKRKVVWRAKFIDAYGAIEVEPGATVDVRLRFAGHFYDEDLELFYNRFRDYDPRLGRYLQADPLGHEGSINLYSYPANPVVDVDLRGLVHKSKKTPKSEAEGGDAKPEGETPAKKTPPHADIPLNKMSKEQLQDTCKHHADELAVAQDSRPGKKNNNTFSVGVIEDGNGNRRLVATNNLDANQGPGPKTRDHMKEHGIQDASDQPPRFKRVPVKDADGNPVRDESGKKVMQTVDSDTGEVVDKSKRSDHHAEQRMNNMPLEDGESLVAQSPSQGCCAGCHSALSQPDASGNKPIDKIPADRQRRKGR